VGEIHFSCPHCGAQLHVGEQFAGRLVKCPKCSQTSKAPAPLADRPKDESVLMAEDLSSSQKAETFAVQLARAFVYPFKGSGIFLLIAGTATLFLLMMLARVFCFVSFLILMFLGYLWSYYISIIASSAAGEKELPDWPDLSSFWDDILRPILLVMADGIVSLAPLIIYAVIITRWQFYSDSEPTPPLVHVFVVWALLYFPMGLLAIALFDSVAALNPVLIIRTIAKIPFRYLLACVFFFLVYYVNISVKGYLAQIPIVGIVVKTFFSLYMMMVAMRILGLIYHTNAQKIGWFEPTK